MLTTLTRYRTLVVALFTLISVTALAIFTYSAYTDTTLTRELPPITVAVFLLPLATATLSRVLRPS